MQRIIEHIIPQPPAPGMVGDGFRVYTYFPGHGGEGFSQRRLSPFLLLDFNAEIDFSPSETVRGVGAHPHKGFETVTIAYKGSVAHNDSAGNSGVVHAGDVQWMTAGSGILHKEYHEPEYSRKGGPFEMVQLWINLPKKDKGTAPHYQSLTKDQMGRLELPNNQGHVDVIAGKFNGVQGPAHTYSPLHVSNLYLNKGASLTTAFPAAYNTALLLINGSAEVNGRDAAEHDFILFANEGDEITIRATNGPAILLLLSGEPINEPIARYGPFVMNTQEELEQSLLEVRRGAYGVLE